MELKMENSKADILRICELIAEHKKLAVTEHSIKRSIICIGASCVIGWLGSHGIGIIVGAILPTLVLILFEQLCGKKILILEVIKNHLTGKQIQTLIRRLDDSAFKGLYLRDVENGLAAMMTHPGKEAEICRELMTTCYLYLNSSYFLIVVFVVQEIIVVSAVFFL